MKGNLVHASGDVKQVKVGFSWTTLFFGFFVPFFRKDFKWGALFFIAGAILALFIQQGASVLNLYFAVIYNKIYIDDLIAKGYRPIDNEFKQVLIKKKIEVPDLSDVTSKQLAP